MTNWKGLSEISGALGDEDKDGCLPEYCSMCCGRNWLIFLGSYCLHHQSDWSLPWWWGSKHIWNVVQFLPDHMGWHPRRQPTSGKDLDSVGYYLGLFCVIWGESHETQCRWCCSWGAYGVLLKYRLAWNFNRLPACCKWVKAVCNIDTSCGWPWDQPGPLQIILPSSELTFDR